MREGGRRRRDREGRQEGNEVGRQVEREEGYSGREGSTVVRGNITYSTGVFGTQLIKQRRGEMQKG